MSFDRQTLSRRSWYIIPAVVVLAPVLLGSVHLVTTVFLLSLVCLAAYLFTTQRTGDKAHVHYHPLLLLGTILTGFLLVQALPMPSFLIGLLSPTAAGIQDGARDVIGDSFLWSSLSLEPNATAWEAARLAGLCLLFWIVFALALKPSNASMIQGAVGLSGVVIVLLGMIQWASGSARVLGIYSSPDVTTILGSQSSLGFITPLLNNNHAAGLMVLSALVLLGMALGRERERIQSVAFTGFLINLVGVLVTRSRGGLLALVAGILLFAAIRYFGPRLRKKGTRYTQTTTLIGMGLFLLTTLLLLVSYEVFVLEPMRSPLFADPRTDIKVQLWQAAVPMLKDFPLMGIGRGAFPSVAAAYLGSTVETTSWYAESLPLQILIDIGPLFGTLLIAAVLTFLAPLFFTGLRYSRWLGMTAGLMALGLHNLVDFSLEITGVAIPAIATLAVLTARIKARRLKYRMDHTHHKTSASALSAATVGVLVFLLLNALWSGHSGIRAAQRSLSEECLPEPVINGIRPPDPNCMDTAISAVSLHPSDHQLFKMGGAISLLSGDVETSARWVFLAMQLCPGCLGPKLLAAEIFLSHRKVEEAARIFGDIFTDRPEATKRIFRKMSGSRHTPEVLAHLFRGRPLKADEFARHLIQNGNGETAKRFLLTLIGLDGRQPGRLLKLGRIHLLEGDIPRADRIATEILGLFPDSPDGYALQGMVETARGNCLTALAMLKEARARKPSHLQLALDELLCLAKIGDYELFDRSAAHLRRRINGLQGPSYQYHLAMAIRFSRGKRIAEALHELDQAEVFLPSSPVIPLVRGRIHYKIGDFQRAAQAFREVLQLRPGNREATSMLKKLELR